MSYIELDFISISDSTIVGCDEVGRGPLAGPVVAASACLRFSNPSDITELLEFLKLELKVMDSKKLTTKKRRKIFEYFGIDLETLSPNRKVELVSGQNFSLEVAITEISETCIDEINILNASLLAMKNSVDELVGGEYTKVLIDGNKKFNIDCTYEQFPIVKGDSKSVVIGLASIFAKEYRDNLMEKLGEIYPGYGLESHAGYPTKLHKEAIATFGITPIHRKSFKGVKEYI